MFWNKYTFSLRTQVTLWFSVLFAGISAATIIFAGHNLQQLLIRRMDQNLEDISNRCRVDYLVGKHARQLGMEFPVYDLPTDLLASLDQHLPGFIPAVAYEPAAADPYSSPTVFGYVDNKIFLTRKNADGKIYSRELKTAPNIHLVKRRLKLKAKEIGSDLFYYRFSAPDGKIISESGNMPKKIELPPAGTPVSGKNIRLLVRNLPDGAVLTVGRNLAVIHTRVEHYVADFLVIGIPLLGAGIITVWLIAGRVAAGIRKVGEAASDIAGGNYSRRVTGHYHGQEIAELILAFNKMSGNTERLLNELRSATDDVAHDLKTPLTRIRGLAEVTVRGPRDFEIWGDALGNIAEECDDMVAIINTMLEITRTESNIEHFQPETFDLKTLLSRLYELYHPAAEEQQIVWEIQLPDQAVPVRADRIKCQRMIGNLLDNTLKFVPPGGKVLLKLHAEESSFIRLQVIDNGPGIPDQDKVRVFERFVRLDSSRTRRGNGLGLAMVRAVAQAHGGSVQITDTPGGGATFTILLPAPSGNSAEPSGA